ncbi:hypothetical protein [Paenibacillus naphthalenovorans]|uniref:hypothetical protein n=2 Tax=Paenibacillus TaxID=44249 RepID=UPI001485429E|nr:hypothetical protein [Paenibacillus naphthalenovorans]
MEMHGLLEVLFQTRRKTVLATVIETEGHACRKSAPDHLHDPVGLDIGNGRSGRNHRQHCGRMLCSRKI